MSDGIADAKVGDTIPFFATFDEDTTACTTRVIRRNGGVDEFLQADLTTFSASDHQFTDGTDAILGFGNDYILPASAEGYFLVFVKQSNDPDLEDDPYIENYRVLAQDADDVFDTLSDLQSDFNNFETINQNEHDATQGKIDQVGAASEAQLVAPYTTKIPDSGTVTFVLDFVLKDLDLTPVALVDPDSEQVDISAIDQNGAPPTGITLGGSPAGRMTRVSLGRYRLTVTLASTGVDETQIRWTAAYSKSGTANVAIAVTTLGDFDQLDSIQSDLTAHRAEVEPELDQIKQDTTTDLPAAITAAQIAVIAQVDANEVKIDIVDAQVDAIRATDVPAIQANVDAAEAAILAQLGHATYGLAALNADLDAILLRLGITTDTGGTTSAGTAMAKLNAILAATTTAAAAARADTQFNPATDPEP